MSFPPNNPDVGKVSFRIEAWPHDPGANGEDYHSGHLPAVEMARILRNLADRCESWADPECPWAGDDGHAPEPPPIDDEQRRRDEEAKRRAHDAARERRTPVTRAGTADTDTTAGQPAEETR